MPTAVYQAHAVYAGGTCVVGNDHRAAISTSMQLQFRTDLFATLQYCADAIQSATRGLLQAHGCTIVPPQTGH